MTSNCLILTIVRIVLVLMVLSPTFIASPLFSLVFFSFV